jgi:hypothetical protein
MQSEICTNNFTAAHHGTGSAVAQQLAPVQATPIATAPPMPAMVT